MILSILDTISKIYRFQIKKYIAAGDGSGGEAGQTEKVNLFCGFFHSRRAGGTVYYSHDRKQHLKRTISVKRRKQE